jgi:hypothetical protein
MLNEIVRENVVRYDADADFKRAALYFRDGSFIEFEHSSLHTRWARPSLDGTMADTICRSIRIFRLNAKHLQLFFEDGTDVEFFKAERTR